MSFGGGGSQTTRTETKQVLSPEQQYLLQLAMPNIREFAATVPQRYQGTQVAPFDPAQVRGQEMALRAGATQDDIARNAANASSFYTSGSIWDPTTNPNLKGAIDAAVRPIRETLTETALPAIRSEFATGGNNFGSSRRGIAEGLAIRGAETAAADAAAKIANNQYETNVNAQLKALAMTPQVQGMQTTGALTTSGVGDVRQGYERELIDAAMGNFNYDQYAPFLQSRDILSVLGAIPGGSNVSTATGPAPKANPVTSAAGGALAGASLGSVIPGVGTTVGAGVGGLLGLLFR